MPPKKPEKKKETPQSQSHTIAQNRKAFHDYAIEDKLEAGIVLMGSEVKSLRNGNANIQDAYAGEMAGGLFLINAHIGEYKQSRRWGHEPTRPRQLLIHKKQLKTLLGKVKTKGFTLVPLALYFNSKGLVKLSLGLGRGKKQFEKRETIKRREWDREKAEALKARNRRG